MIAPNKTVVQITGILEKLFEEHFEKKPDSIEALAVSGSDRRYSASRVARQLL